MARYPQDLHIHTTFSKDDASVVPAQTLELVARVKHADVIGISDHFEHLIDDACDEYLRAVKHRGFFVGTEVDGADSALAAAEIGFDYYLYHCYDAAQHYRALEHLLATERPVIIAHPNALNTNLKRLPAECLLELNNRYIWQTDWMRFFAKDRRRFRFVISSDAHQPSWLGQSVARCAAAELGVTETLLAPLLTAH